MHYLVTITQWKEIPFSLFYGSAIQDLEGLTSLPVSDDTGRNFRFLLLQVLHYCWAHGWVAIYTYSLSSLARTPHWLFPPHILLLPPFTGSCIHTSSYSPRTRKQPFPPGNVGQLQRSHGSPRVFSPGYMQNSGKCSSNCPLLLEDTKGEKYLGFLRLYLGSEAWNPHRSKYGPFSSSTDTWSVARGERSSLFFFTISLTLSKQSNFPLPSSPSFKSNTCSLFKNVKNSDKYKEERKKNQAFFCYLEWFVSLNAFFFLMQMLEPHPEHLFT